MLSFLPGYAWFAIGGLIAAAAPFIIHLLNRRRYRVINWAAMDFLKAAIQRNRKILQLRDLLLLLLRTAAIALFGLALAKPFFQQSTADFQPNSPLHVALVVDNSLSMGYQQLQGQRVLDDAKQRAEEVINALPDRSQVAVIPWCGSELGRTRDSYRNKTDAIEAVRRIEIVDRRGTVNQAVDLALEAFTGSELPESARRIVLVSDNQEINWPRAGWTANSDTKLPELIVLNVATKKLDNSWVDSVEVVDGVADVNTPTIIKAVVRHQGSTAREDVQVSLVINSEIKESKKVKLDRDQRLELQFSYRFAAEERLPGTMNPMVAAVTLTPDQLPADDTRSLIIPILDEVPVVFIDQYGARGETPDKRGETWPLRKLLAPRTSRSDDAPQLIRVKHVTPDEVNQELLRDARLVVLGGIVSPGDLVPLLHEYVQQGGPLLITAGGNFDPKEWNEFGWNNGQGILPLPLTGMLTGKLRDEITNVKEILSINPDTLVHAYFQFPDQTLEQRAQFYITGGGGFQPVIFRYAETLASESDLAKWQKLAQEQFDKTQQAWTKLEQAEQELVTIEKQRQLTGEDLVKKEQLRKQRQQLQPQWLLWASELGKQNQPRLSWEKFLEQEQPRVLAKLSNNVPLIVERKLGQGTVTFLATGCLPQWNLLSVSGVWVVMEKIMRAQLAETLPNRNLIQIEQWQVPVSDNLGRFTLQRPQNSGTSGREEPLAVEALGGDEYGLTIRNVTQRGIYKVRQYRNVSEGTTNDPIAVTPFAVNGPAEESQLQSLTQLKFAELNQSKESNATVKPAIIWIERGEPVNLSSTAAWGESLWWWFALTVLLCLLFEMLIAAWPSWNRVNAGKN
jgi:hypothetical protein